MKREEEAMSVSLSLIIIAQVTGKLPCSLSAP